MAAPRFVLIALPRITVCFRSKPAKTLSILLDWMQLYGELRFIG